MPLQTLQISSPYFNVLSILILYDSFCVRNSHYFLSLLADNLPLRRCSNIIWHQICAAVVVVVAMVMSRCFVSVPPGCVETARDPTGAPATPNVTSAAPSEPPPAAVTGNVAQNGENKPPQAIVKPHVLTHVIEGFVIQEGAEPFPVSCNKMTTTTTTTVLNVTKTLSTFKSRLKTPLFSCAFVEWALWNWTDCTI